MSPRSKKPEPPEEGGEPKENKDLIREQFTKTAEVFGSFAVATRGGEADWLARAVRARSSDRVVDVACGPGSMALRFAPHVGWICGLDLTPAILQRAKQSAADQKLTNIEFAIGDAQQLPFADNSLDIAITSYSLHHMLDAALVICEMTRVVRRGGRVGVVDIRVSEDPMAGALNNRIERLRDASHTRTLRRSEFNVIFEANNLRVTGTQVEEHPRQFDHWLHVAGLHPGDAGYDQTRKLMTSTMDEDSAGFHPRFEVSRETGKKELMITNTVLMIAGQKT